jgi:hypothetical protein
MRVAITQEDDSTLEGMVVDYNADDNTHFVICNLGTPDEAGDALPLVEYPDACQVRQITRRYWHDCCEFLGGCDLPVVQQCGRRAATGRVRGRMPGEEQRYAVSYCC